MQSGVIYSLFEVSSEDSKAKIGLSCGLDSIMLSYDNPPDTVYTKSNFPVISGLNTISD